MNNSIHNSGFTLIELIVVVSIISIVLFFSFPLFRDINILGDPGGDPGSLARLVEDLKKRAVMHQQDYMLYIDKPSGKIWVTHENMSAEEQAAAQEKATLLSGDIQLVGLQFAGKKSDAFEERPIRFRKLGYSDHVLIQLSEGDRRLTLLIEPFLSQTTILDRHINFEECI